MPAAVRTAFTEAEAQLRRYLADPRLDQVQGPRGCKAVSVVFCATQAIYYRELGGAAHRA